MKYYSYYNFGGGYKDLYLGSSNQKDEKSFFLPLLATLPEDKSRDYSLLTMMQRITRDNNFGFPNEAVKFFSHGSYKLCFASFGSFEGLAISDIEEQLLDDNGRPLYCTFFFLSESIEETQVLCRIAKQFLISPVEWSKFMVGLFTYDAEKNGFSFETGKLKQWIADHSDKDVTTIQPTMHKPIHLFAKSANYSCEYVCKDMGLRKDDIGCMLDFPLKERYMPKGIESETITEQNRVAETSESQSSVLPTQSESPVEMDINECKEVFEVLRKLALRIDNIEKGQTKLSQIANEMYNRILSETTNEHLDYKPTTSHIIIAVAIALALFALGGVLF